MEQPPADGSVVITPTDMYKELRDMRAVVDKVANTVDPALAEIRKDLSELKSDGATRHTEVSTVLSDHGRRITVLETQRAAAWAAIGLILVALGVVAAFLAAR